MRTKHPLEQHAVIKEIIAVYMNMLLSHAFIYVQVLNFALKGVQLYFH